MITHHYLRERKSKAPELPEWAKKYGQTWKEVEGKLMGIARRNKFTSVTISSQITDDKYLLPDVEIEVIDARGIKTTYYCNRFGRASYNFAAIVTYIEFTIKCKNMQVRYEQFSPDGKKILSTYKPLS